MLTSRLASGVAAIIVIALVIPAAARDLQSLGGTALRVMSRLTEPMALLVVGTALAGLARVLGRRRQPK